MQLKLIILSTLGFVLCGLVFSWGIVAMFRPDHLRRYEARITRIHRFGIRPSEYKPGPTIVVAGLIAMVISLVGIIQAVDICLDQLSPNSLAALTRPHGVTPLQPIVGGCLVLFGAVLFLAPSFLLRTFSREYPPQDAAIRPHRPSIPAKIASVFPMVIGIWMIVLWFQS